MSSYTVSTNSNIDSLVSKAGSDTYVVNTGATLTVDQDTRFGQNANTSAGMGNININTATGGTVLFDSTKVRLIPFGSGSGVVPAFNTSITQGSASGLLIGVYADLTTAPVAPAGAMPATGFIKIKQWNSVAFTATALAGITATATGADTAAWLEIVGVNSLGANISRLGNVTVTGDWYLLPNTTGSNATTYQIPSNGAIVYLPGVWVETAVSSGLYEFYPCAGSLTALAASVSTDAVRGKLCWISTAGVLRFQNDGTNSTGGFLPVSGLRVRIPNIFFMCCTAAALTVNVLPNATPSTRYSIGNATANGTYSIDRCSMAWYASFKSTYSLTVTNSGILTQLTITNQINSFTLNNVGIGQEAANVQQAFTLTECKNAGTVTDFIVTVATAPASSLLTALSDSDRITFTRMSVYSLVAKAAANTLGLSLTNVTNCTWTNLKLSGGGVVLASCFNNTFKNSTYWDTPTSTTPITNGIAMFQTTSAGQNLTIDGIDFGGLFMCQPYLGILNTGSGTGQGFDVIKIRNLGTPASPLDLGGAQTDATWARTTTTATVTTGSAHGLKTNDNVYVYISDSVAAIVLGSKTITVTGTTTYTFTCLNAGNASGNLTYFPRVCQNLYSIGTAITSLQIQRCYIPHIRTAIFSDPNGGQTAQSLFQDIQSDYTFTTQYLGALSRYSGVPNSGGAALVAQPNIFGTHWVDGYITGAPANTAAQAWARTTTTATVTSTAHGLKTGDVIVATVSSDTAAIVLGQKTITALTSSTFTFTCLNAGGASGTLTYNALNGIVAVIGNESVSSTASQYTVDVGAVPFASGQVLFGTNGNQVTWVTPDYIIGNSGFPIAEMVMNNNGGSDVITNYTVTYAMDKNDGTGYGSFHNLYFQSAGGSGTSGLPSASVTSATGIEIGDYVFGTGIGPNCKVTNIVSNTLTLDTNNSGTVSGTLRFAHLPSEVIDAQLGFKMQMRVKRLATNTNSWGGLYFFTASTPTSRAVQHVLDPVTVSVTVKDANSGAAVVGAMVLVEADTGGTLPAGATVTSITSSGTTATVTHTAHGLLTNTFVIIRGANETPYNGSQRITVVDANTYTYTVSGSPATPATGTITSSAQILKGVTDGTGTITSTTYAYTANQPVKGKARKGTSAPYYQTATISGTVTSTGLTYLVLAIADS